MSQWIKLEIQHQKRSFYSRSHLKLVCPPIIFPPPPSPTPGKVAIAIAGSLIWSASITASTPLFLGLFVLHKFPILYLGFYYFINTECLPPPPTHVIKPSQTLSIIYLPLPLATYPWGNSVHTAFMYMIDYYTYRCIFDYHRPLTPCNISMGLVRFQVYEVGNSCYGLRVVVLGGGGVKLGGYCQPTQSWFWTFFCLINFTIYPPPPTKAELIKKASQCRALLESSKMSPALNE